VGHSQPIPEAEPKTQRPTPTAFHFSWNFSLKFDVIPLALFKESLEQ
jgi:hypothetical protein